MHTTHHTRRTVVVTGAGTGIGRATARLFATRGARVLAVGRRAHVLAETADGHPGIEPLALDITEPGAPREIVRAVGERLDVLVNNAGVVRSGALGDIKAEDADTQLATNLLAPLHLTQAALPVLGPGSVVVNVSTAIGQRAWPGNSVYAATKAALDSFTRCWAVELAPRGVRVVAVGPGAIDTPIGDHQGLSPERKAQVREWQLARTPLRRIGTPEEVAWVVAGLSAPEAGFVTGAVVPVDGGAVVG
ncbi:NAD(P)-dependent dehydrogenase (short-subunit alcohol dehydrogenase family) [Crossiella equi]|uniref:NAD(P)-dependent dehydrogenase (Short-subunit alcohol dehydrogenase family) n=1 Tax=Crossiella equi TaxID=130796 RepID=A0ABS5AKZ5_9PSEU|nr:SDR family oxidoreductase [Crossiella equi]MBP2477247.1 NAD(P)-dependent dehydrogenase (short-subunit alcohol dehydrogenase family) [Crossiella equi]